LFAIRNERDMITKSDFGKAIDKLLKREGGKGASSTYL